MVLLKEMPSNVKVYNLFICHTGLLFLVNDSLSKRNHVHDSIPSVLHKKNERKWISEVD